MRTTRFGRTGVRVPVVSLGTWSHGGTNQVGDRSVGWSGHDDAQAAAALRAAHQAGITHWDTADVYGDGRAEALIGQAWGDVPRDEVFLATKVGWDPGPHGHYYHPEQVRARLERSLRLLRTEVIDLYYLHHCDFGPDDAHLEPALALLRRFRAEGKIRWIGLSDWDCGKIMRVIARVDPDAVQPYRNVVDDEWESSGLRAWVAEHDLGVAFFSPIQHGLLLGKYSAPVEWPEGDFRRNVEGFRDAELLAALRERRDRLAARFARLPQPVLNPLLGALLEDAPTACTLLGMRSPEQVRSAAAAGEPLDPADAAWVRALYRELSS
jgi:aryl-alcohol dehydrogenase-like predicted oxidoreductase